MKGRVRMNRRKLTLFGALAFVVCAFVFLAVFYFYGPPIASGAYSSADKIYHLNVSEAKIEVSKNGVPFAHLENSTRRKPLVDSDNEKRRFVLKDTGNGCVTLVRVENPPYDRREILFIKD